MRNGWKCGAELLGSAVFYKRKSLLNQVVALSELVDCLMDEIVSDFIKTMCEIMQLLCMMAVMTQHVSEQCQSLLRRGCSVAVRMCCPVCMRVLMDVSAMLVGMCY